MTHRALLARLGVDPTQRCGGRLLALGRFFLPQGLAGRRLLEVRSHYCTRCDTFIEHVPSLGTLIAYPITSDCRYRRSRKP